MNNKLTTMSVVLCTALLAACAGKETKQETAPAAQMASPAPAVKTPDIRSFSADELFGVGKATLKKEGSGAQSDLDKVAEEFKASNGAQMIYVTGHSDRTGNAQANKALSLQRANAVRDYLVKKGVAKNRITFSGVGSSKSITQCNSEKGKALTECLAPDRRVEVEVVESK